MTLIRSMFVAMILSVAFLAGCASAQGPSVWHSEAAACDLPVSVNFPAGATTQKSSVPAVIILQNLSFRVVRPDADSAAERRMLDDGNAVIRIDYAGASLGGAEEMTGDLLKIRKEIKEKKFPLDLTIDVDRIWILPQGVQLKRDIPFFTTDQKAWKLDIAYPVDPPKPAPTLMEITCDNANRMGNFSLVYCQDSLLEGALLRGFAASMIDHPVPAPYKGLDDPMPDLIHRLKGAVRTIRAQSTKLALNGKIGAIGFSRGGPMAAFLAVTNGRAEFEVGGENRDESSDVQAALVHGNRYDYSQLGSDDPMLARFEKAWGVRAMNADAWLKHGAVHYLQTAAVPMFLNTSDAESKEYREGLRILHERLEAVGVDHIFQIDNDGRGHRVSTDQATLGSVYAFFSAHLE